VSIYKKGKNLINFKYWKYALVLSLPMIPHLVAHLILGQSDRIFIDKFVGSDYVGIYSFAYNIGLISHILLSSLNNAWVPWFYKKMDEKNYNKIVDKSRYYILLLISFIIGLIYVSPEIVKIMAPIEYSEAIWIIPVIVMSYFFQFLYTILVNIQFYYKKNFFIPLGTVIAGLVNIGLNIYYIPLYGYAAAAYTTLASYVILFLLHYIITRYFIKSDIYTFVFFIKPILLVIILTSIFFFLTEEILIRYVMLLFVFTIVLIKYRLKIIKFIK
jgi:O-antigen/teichoic acid export membrane protein